MFVKYNLALSTSAAAEGAFEANDVYKRGVEELENEFYEIYGRKPETKEEKERIESIAKSSANFTMSANIAFLYLNNRINWGSLFKPTNGVIKEAITGSFGSIARTSTKPVQKGLNTVYEVVSKTPETTIGKILLNGEKAAKYMRRTITEGLEEGYQFMVSEGSLDYAKDRYDPSNLSDVSNFMKSFNEGLKKTFGTNEGWDNIISGFIGGMFGGGIVNRVTGGRGDSKAAIQQQVNLLNKYNLTGFLSNKFEEAALQTALGKRHKDAVEKGDVYTAKNIKFDMLYNYIASGIRANSYEKRIDELDRALNVDSKTFSSVWGMEDTKENRESIKNFIEGIKTKAEEIKKNVDKVELLTKNPHKYGTLDWSAYEQYKDALSLNLSRYKEYQRRINSVKEDLTKIAPLLRFEDAVKATSIQGISELMKNIQSKSDELAIQIRDTEDEGLKNSLFEKKKALDSLFGRLQPIVYSGTKTEGNITDVKFDSKEYVGVLRDLFDLINGVDYTNNKYIVKYKERNNPNISEDLAELNDDDLADALQKLQDIYKLSEANYNIGKYYTYLRKGLGAKNFIEKFKNIVEEARKKVEENEEDNDDVDVKKEQARQKAFENVTMGDSFFDEEGNPIENAAKEFNIVKEAAKKAANGEDLTKEEGELILKHTETFDNLVNLENDLNEQFPAEKKNDVEKQRGGRTKTNNKYDGISPDLLLLNMYINPRLKNVFDNLRKAIFGERFNPNKLTIVKTVRNIERETAIPITYRSHANKEILTGLYRDHFNEVMQVMYDNKPVGEIRPPESIYLDGDYTRPLFDEKGRVQITLDEYNKLTNNDVNTYNSFVEELENYYKAYQQLKEKGDGTHITDYFHPVINTGTTTISKRAEDDTLLKDITLRNGIIKIKRDPSGKNNFDVKVVKNGDLSQDEIDQIGRNNHDEKFLEILGNRSEAIIVVFPISGVIRNQSFVRARVDGNFLDKSKVRVATSKNVFDNFTISFRAKTEDEIKEAFEENTKTPVRPFKTTNKKQVKEMLKNLFNYNEEESDAVADMFDMMSARVKKTHGVSLYDELSFGGIEAFRDINENDILYQVIRGVGASNLEKNMKVATNRILAEHLLSEGKSMLEIKRETGWEMDRDGEWVYEVIDEVDRKSLNSLLSALTEAYEDYAEQLYLYEQEELADKAAEVKEPYINVTLETVLKPNSILLKAYPVIKDYNLYIGNTNTYSDDGTVDVGTLGAIDIKNKAIILKSGRSLRSTTTSLIHELQHLIQNEEGVSSGASSSEKNLLLISDYILKNKDRFTEDEVEQTQRLRDNILNNKPYDKKFGNKLYKNVKGEIEARNASIRYGMSKKKRSNSLLTDTEDMSMSNSINTIINYTKVNGTINPTEEDINECL